uniref:Uncharacterized protein n=1 Tax=Hanusia phi TaxID=3032 RepID=A0A7S0EIZ0_9CRYP
MRTMAKFARNFSSSTTTTKSSSSSSSFSSFSTISSLSSSSPSRISSFKPSPFKFSAFPGSLSASGGAMGSWPSSSTQLRLSPLLGNSSQQLTPSTARTGVQDEVKLDAHAILDSFIFVPSFDAFDEEETIMEAMNRNARKPNKANHGKRPCSHWGRKRRAKIHKHAIKPDLKGERKDRRPFK